MVAPIIVSGHSFLIRNGSAALGEQSGDRASVPTPGNGFWRIAGNNRPMLMETIANRAAKTDLHVFRNLRRRRFVAEVARESRSAQHLCMQKWKA
jgi:hypothetical protein